MVTQITQGIKISVLTNFEGTYFKNHKIHFAFSYEVSIENHSKDSVQLTSRHWEIFDSLNEKETVDGEGVIDPYVERSAFGGALSSGGMGVEGWRVISNERRGESGRSGRVCGVERGGGVCGGTGGGVGGIKGRVLVWELLS